MKHRILSLLLVLALAALCLAGCAKTEEAQTVSEEPTAEAAAPVAEEAPAEAAPAEETEEPEAPAEAAAPAEEAEEPEAPADAEAPTVDEAPAQDEAPAPTEEPVDISAAALKGPTGMGMAYLIDAAQGGSTVGETTFDNYTIEVSGDPSQVVSKVIAGEYDIACLPTNSAAVVYQKTAGQVRLLAVNTLGVLHILQYTADGSQPITDWEGLRGQTIYATGQGANPEYVLNYLLRQNGLEPGVDVTVQFCGTHDELVAQCTAGSVQFCMIPEPNATVVLNSVEGFTRVLDLSEEWAKTGTELMMGCVVVQKAFAEAHPDAVERFLEAYETSVNWALENRDAAAALIAQVGIVPAEGVAKQALPNCHLTFQTGLEAKEALSAYYQILFDADPASVGGAVPDEGFYAWGE